MHAAASSPSTGAGLGSSPVPVSFGAEVPNPEGSRHRQRRISARPRFRRYEYSSTVRSSPNWATALRSGSSHIRSKSLLWPCWSRLSAGQGTKPQDTPLACGRPEPVTSHAYSPSVKPSLRAKDCNLGAVRRFSEAVWSPEMNRSCDGPDIGPQPVFMAFMGISQRCLTVFIASRSTARAVWYLRVDHLPRCRAHSNSRCNFVCFIIRALHCIPGSHRKGDS